MGEWEMGIRWGRKGGWLGEGGGGWHTDGRDGWIVQRFGLNHREIFRLPGVDRLDEI